MAWIHSWNLSRNGAPSRVVRGLAGGIWLVYLVVPLSAWNTSRHGALYADGVVALLTAFAVIYIGVVVTWDDYPRLLRPGLAVIGVRKRFELTRQLTQAREEVARLAASEERLRLARDMHDLTGQSLSMITLKSELAARLVRRLPDSPERDRVRDEVEEVAAISRQTLHDIRQAISGYRRPTLAVEVITARNALESAGITARDDAEVTLLSGTFDADAEAALAWCLREAVTNVVRHSGARNCFVGLARRTGGFGRAGTISMDVRDDGCGGVGPEGRGTGLHSMSERLSAVGGQLEIRPGADGFRLVATVPDVVPARASVQL